MCLFYFGILVKARQRELQTDLNLRYCFFIARNRLSSKEVLFPKNKYCMHEPVRNRSHLDIRVLIHFFVGNNMF